MGWSAEDASEGSAEDASEGSRLDLLQVIFFIVTGVELVGAVLFMFGVEKLGIDMLIMYLLFTGIVLHHFWMKGLESSTMHTLAFTQILTVLGLLLYVRETLYQDVPTQRKSFVSHKSKSKTPAVIVETLDVDDDGEEAEVELPPVASKKKKKKKKTSKKGATLERIRQRIDTIDFGTIGTASHDERDDLQRIKGIGPFIEEKLHALEIYTFRQIAAMTPVIEDNVNIAIEFFIGRIRRDEWRRQAQEFVDENGYD
jgi:predicted flap endonuclease-1-like 5' DNA nuclease